MGSKFKMKQPKKESYGDYLPHITKYSYYKGLHQVINLL